ncbi:hypothetical protein POTOM_049510 [Populus tomentosa]|uniref:Uncharacterized protein n=1 Tax=Populus tomentosa TaxID=118781 RepID=A0A8X7YL06_POPTO|nr:hypothetical protein POTOM_049510 [Populus tomentosa]
MVKVAGFFAMSVGAFIFWQTMDKIHVWNALRQDEKVPGNVSIVGEVSPLDPSCLSIAKVLLEKRNIAFAFARLLDVIQLHHVFNSFEPAIAITVKHRLPVLYGLNWEFGDIRVEVS